MNGHGGTVLKPQVTMTFRAGGLPSFSLLLQSGFVVRAGACGSIRVFLEDELGLAPQFIEQVIQSIFLDGKPVDDLDSAHVKDGCTLALSAAMPGLVGATMRRGGYYASLRSGISYSSDDRCHGVCCGDVTVKLFNLVAAELGTGLLERGIEVKSHHLEDFLASRPAEFWADCQSVVVDGRETGKDELAKTQWGSPLVFFTAKGGAPGQTSRSVEKTSHSEHKSVT
ncbi:MAG: hypothetical protein HGB17_08305 [Syntrophobacteraceae bacterium]|nr:hypothetical protein [Syntrophobacteraceae bacterium]